ncbi:MAG: bifunctional 2-polyprenyl-6-hydroxyphenol methylase/3-demethylubiquinol 3-O-methyltransferase UbiG [Vampirovibrionales bacterium]
MRPSLGAEVGGQPDLMATAPPTSPTVNNDFYNDLGAHWWSATDHMITFLRHESVIRLDFIGQHLPPDGRACRLLDLGCGAGFISIPLAQAGHQVTAVDCSRTSLDVLLQEAEKRGCAQNITVVEADLRHRLPVPDDFDMVLAMDILEHVDQPQQIIAKAAGHLKPGGRFLYHTLNQTVWCWLVYLQLGPRLIRHSPKDLHRWDHNIPPAHLLGWLEVAGLLSHPPRGVHAPLFQRATWDLLTTRSIQTPMRFEYISSLAFSYIGMAEKRLLSDEGGQGQGAKTP